MNCVVLQPSYIPWRGYFHQIWKADVFVFYDDVQYDRHGWRNRNRIPDQAGSGWLTVPVHARGYRSGLKICDVEIAWETQPRWPRKHIETLRRVYARAPNLAQYVDLLERHFDRREVKLVDLLIQLTTELAAELGATHTKFLRSSELRISGDRNERLLGILKAVGATHYISGPSAAAYIDEARFAAAGISLEYMRYDYPDYEQIASPFDGRVSIIDLLMMKGRDAPAYIWGA